MPRKKIFLLVIIIGPDELLSGTAKMKDLKSGVQNGESDLTRYIQI